MTAPSPNESSHLLSVLIFSPLLAAVVVATLLVFVQQNFRYKKGL